MQAHILVIDDDVADRIAMSTILRRAGYQVTTAPNGRAALDLLGTVVPNLILLDMLMPEMTGWDFLIAREEMASLFAVPVLVITGMSLPDSVWAQELGVEDVIEKPVDAEQLLRRVRRRAG